MNISVITHQAAQLANHTGIPHTIYVEQHTCSYRIQQGQQARVQHPSPASKLLTLYPRQDQSSHQLYRYSTQESLCEGSLEDVRQAYQGHREDAQAFLDPREASEYLRDLVIRPLKFQKAM